MLIGEQPGDKEDLAGRPFVGPAGLKLNEALEEAGVERQKVYVTNAVKHFKYVPRGKIRLHQKPVTGRDQSLPPMARARTGFRPAESRGRDGRDGGAVAVRQGDADQQEPRTPCRSRQLSKALITIHPSYLLRIQEEADARVEYARFVSDLKLLLPFLGREFEARLPRVRAQMSSPPLAMDERRPCYKRGLGLCLQLEMLRRSRWRGTGSV